MLRERGGEGAGDGRGTDDGQLMTKAGPGVLALLELRGHRRRSVACLRQPLHIELDVSSPACSRLAS